MACANHSATIALCLWAATPYTAPNEERTLFANYVIGMVVCERAIEEGRYLQAHALLRQEMETLAQLKAVSAGKRKDSSSPNVKVLEKSLSRLYDELSAAAHVSKHHIVRAATELDVSGWNVPKQTNGTRYFPAFDEGLARRSFGLHLILTLRLLEELSADVHKQHGNDGFTERESEAVNLAVKLMIALLAILSVSSNGCPCDMRWWCKLATRDC